MDYSTKLHPARKFAGFAGLLLVMLTMMACALLSSAPAKRNAAATAQPAATMKPAANEALTVPTAAAETVNTPTPPAEMHGAALEGELPRSFQYGALTFNLQAALITAQPPEGADPADQRGAYAQTVWQIANPTGDNQRVNSGVMTLKLSGGEYTRPLEITVGPQSSQDLTLVFSVPAGSTWAGASTSLAEPNKVPAVLTLEGPVPAPDAPTSVAISGDVQVKSPNLLEYKLVNGATDLNGLGLRADSGTHLLLLKVTATCKDRFDCYVGPNLFNILIDGKPAEALKMDPISAAVKVNTSQDFQVVFQVPDAAKTLALQVGEVGKDTQQILLHLSGN